MWFSRFFGRPRPGSSRRTSPRRVYARRLGVEPLEDRSVPSATFVAGLGHPPGLSAANGFAEMKGALFFSADGGLFRTDGTTAGTTLVRGGSASNLTHVNGTLFFTSGTQLWKTDGTAAGTTHVADLPSSPTPYLHFTASNGKLFFTAVDPTVGKELWVSDGTGAGTGVVKDILPGKLSSHPENLTDVNGTLFFTAYDRTDGRTFPQATNRELWTSDGTAEGTVKVKEIVPGDSYGGFHPLTVTAVNGTLYFVSGHVSTYGLWKSDGTEDGTVLVKPMSEIAPGGIDQLVNFNGTLYFTAGGRQLWMSDGTAEGTVHVTTVPPSDGATTIYRLMVADGQMFFAFGRHTASGWTNFFDAKQLWKSDGTAEGTALVTDRLQLSNLELHSPSLLGLGGTLFFVANDGTHGWELWQSDGTDAGTVLVQDVNPGSASAWPTGIQAYRPRLQAAGGKLFFAADRGATGRELWVVGAPAVTSDLSWSGGGLSAPSGVAAGQPFTVNRTYTVTGAEVSAFTIAYYGSVDDVFGNADDFLLGTETVDSEQGRAVGTHAGTSPAFTIGAAGSYFLFARLDDGDQVSEGSETNNVAQATVAVTAPSGADLNWSNGGILVATPVEAGAAFQVSRTYSVTGADVAAFVIGYYASLDDVFGNEDDFLLGIEAVDSQDGRSVGSHAGASPAFQIDTPGTYYVFARLDDNHQLSEADEANNVALAPAQVEVLP